MSIALALAVCASPVVIDGDTFRCGQVRYRIGGIDAPDKSCTGRRAGNCAVYGPRGDWLVSRDYLRRALARGRLTLHIYKGATYGRRIAAVCVRGANIGAVMIAEGYAVYKPTWNGAAVRVRCK